MNLPDERRAMVGAAKNNKSWSYQHRPRQVLARNHAHGHL